MACGGGDSEVDGLTKLVTGFVAKFGSLGVLSTEVYTFLESLTGSKYASSLFVYFFGGVP